MMRWSYTRYGEAAAMAADEIPLASASFLKSASQVSNAPVLRQLACASATLDAPNNVAATAAATPMIRMAAPRLRSNSADFPQRFCAALPA
jgi:hypothetical protein